MSLELVGALTLGFFVCGLIMTELSRSEKNMGWMTTTALSLLFMGWVGMVTIAYSSPEQTQPKTQMIYLLEDHTSCESYNISSSIVILSNCFHPIMGKIERVINPVNVREIEFEIKNGTTKASELGKLLKK